MPDTSMLVLERRKHVAWVMLNNAEKRNALNREMLKGLAAAFEEIDLDPEIRVAVISGEGKGFCSGMDVSTLAGLLDGATADYRERLRREILRSQECMAIIERCSKPVIAAIHGACIGGGVDLACACDIRVASRDAVFSVRETKLALVADMGTLQRLPIIIGEPWARELALTGRDFDAGNALALGLITHVYEDAAMLRQKAAELAEEIASCSPLAVQGVKDVMRFNRENGVKAGLEYVAQKNAAILICEDAMEAFAARSEKRKPEFKGK